MSGPKSRPGFVLPVTLFAVTFVAAIVTASFVAAHYEDRITRSVRLGTEAFYVAEAGLQELQGTERAGFFHAIDSVVVVGPEAVSVAGDTLGEYTLTVRRLNDRLFLARSEGHLLGRGRDTMAVRTLGAVLRVPPATVPAEAAITVYGALNAAGNSQVNGSDAGGPGCVAGDTVAGVAAVDSSLIDEGEKDRIVGSPPIFQDPSLDTATMNELGDLEVSELEAMADLVFTTDEELRNMQPMTVEDENGTTVCDRSNELNWGDPDRATVCADYFPIIHIQNNAHLTTGVGQGILIVDGDLNISGNLEFYGLVVVKGTIRTSGTGNHIEGVTIVQGSGELDSSSTTTGNSLVQFSRCRATASLQSALRPVPIPFRGWFDLSAVARAPDDS